MQVGLMNSLRKMELTSGSQGITRGKMNDQFLLMINDLKTTNQQSNSIQVNVQNKEGLNRLLAILSNASSDDSLQPNMDMETINDGINANQVRINLEYLVNTYHQFLDGEEIVVLDESNIDAMLADSFANLENEITQELKKAINMKIEPDMFNDTKLPSLLADLKLLEYTGNRLLDHSINEKIAESIQDLQGFMVSLNQFLELNSSNDSKTVEKGVYTKVNKAFMNNNNFIIGFDKQSSSRNSMLQIDKEQVTGEEQDLRVFSMNEESVIPFMLTNLEQRFGQKTKTTSQEAATNPETVAEMDVSKISFVAENPERDQNNYLSSESGAEEFSSYSSEKEYHLPIDAVSRTESDREVITKLSSASEVVKDGIPLSQTTKLSKNDLESEKDNSLSSENSMRESIPEDTVLLNKTEQSAESRGSKNRVSTVDPKLLAMQNQELQENRNAIVQETNATNPKLLAVQNQELQENRNAIVQETNAINLKLLAVQNQELQENRNAIVQETNAINLKLLAVQNQELQENRNAIVQETNAINLKLLAVQNQILQENRNVVVQETNTTNLKPAASPLLQADLFQAENSVTEATLELKSIISSILSKIDKQLEQKSTTVVQKVINPIMVSSLRKSGEMSLLSTEIKETGEVSQGDTDPKVFNTLQNTFVKQHPFMLLTDGGEAVQPKNVEEQFVKLLANSTFTKTGDMQKLSIRLAPDHLGSIRIEITQNEGSMIARIITTTAEAKEVLDKQLNSLKHGFIAQNLQIDKMDVVVSSQPQERLQREQQQQQEQQQSDAQRDKKDAEDNDNKRKTSFIEELLNIEV
ncbi:flagellar hook-length control protein FliK [Niallia sp. FSL W8-1348]|uniref:flagellar hook-length control protein FliK n=1 Tax=Niallia sp. FSL W8-1348 TaxID=2954656 RepID=UPI0030F921AF